MVVGIDSFGVIIMKRVILKVEGMSCSACQNRVEKYLNKQDGVHASVNLIMAQALIEYDDEKVSLKDLDRFIAESGYKSLGVYQEKLEEQEDYTKYYLIVFACFIIVLMYVSMSHMIGLPVIPFLHMINHPIHYGGDTEYECIKVLNAWMTKDEFIGFCKGNALKYLCRSGKKDEILQEYNKAKWYIEKMIERMKSNI